MQIRILTTIHAPSLLGSEPAFEDDVLDVTDEEGAALVESGLAEASTGPIEARRPGRPRKTD